MEQPDVVATAEVTEENPAQYKARASTPTRGDETAGTPPPSSAVEEEDKVPSPSSAEERAQTPAPVEASTLEGSPSRGKGPMIPVTVARGSTEGEEAQVASDEVEEIQGRPHDDCQHVYVWRQRGDHWASHEEITETEEAERVERAAKRLVNEVKVSGLMLCWSICIYIPCFVHCVVCLISAGRNENGEVPEKVL